MLISKLLPRTPTRIKDLFLLLSSLLILYLLHRPIPPTPYLLQLPTSPPTSLHHLLFSIASSSRSLPSRSHFLRLWHSPNTTRTYLFLDQPTVPDPYPDPTLPPTLVSSPTSSFPYSFPRGSRSAIRIARIVKESVSRLDTSGVRWFVFGDDDTVFFTDNLVRTLSKYDPEEWYYIGSGSEGYEPNMSNSFGMAFGGGGFAISASLARVLAGVLDSCLVDARGDIFGMLSAHPLSPLLSLHHLDHVDPIFPKMTRTNALGHLFKAVNVDPGRVLQQTVCYDRSNSLTVSVAWGYAIQVFEGNYYLPDLLRKQRTFSPWRRNKDILSKLYMFDTSEYVSDPCKRPVVFFLKSAVSRSKNVYTDYSRHVVGNCSRTRAVNDLKQIRVFSQKLDLDVGEVKVLRRQCCDILPSFSKLMVINIRQCGVDELSTGETFLFLLSAIKGFSASFQLPFTSLKMMMDCWVKPEAITYLGLGLFGLKSITVEGTPPLQSYLGQVKLYLSSVATAKALFFVHSIKEFEDR
ncbi:hypothetical protein RHGRI_017860 [Rhododendron griersonianum]|uniref:Fringe-like glycosyltransferase domain-containing protein n=1 Tax=Rhododendron griersonianum TaxID=479676 RepID=A0AAV6JZD3_9ERIC|nr:hypothetical protein RHGRI_017860 [Rhododendron griersonianum]